MCLITFSGIDSALKVTSKFIDQKFNLVGTLYRLFSSNPDNFSKRKGKLH